MKHFEHPLKHKPSELLWRMMLAFSVFLLVCGLVLSPWDTLLPGLAAIHRSPDVLISDYFVIGGMGAAMLNAGLVTLASLLLTRRLGLTYSGLSVAAILIMGGFALFGKNLVNCLPILFGNCSSPAIRRKSGTSISSSGCSPPVWRPLCPSSIMP